jgi:transmembrane sensor
MNAGDEASRLADEAAEWLIALSENGEDPGLTAAFETWRSKSPRHGRAWDETVAAYALFGKVAPRHEDAWRHRPAAGDRRLAGIARSGTPAGRRRPSFRRGRAGATVLWAAALCLALLVGPGIVTRLTADYVTATAEVRRVALADGSKAWLAPETIMRLDFTDGARRVTLERGEAFFDVVHDPARPFQVSAAGARTTVLGTAFDVRIAGPGVAVAVRRGHVRVDYRGALASADLGAGQSVALAPGAAPVSGRVDTSDVAAWVDGELVAHDLPVRDVVAALRPYHPGLILIRDERLAAMTVTGIYDLRKPESVLRAVADVHGARIRRLTPWVILLDRG